MDRGQEDLAMYLDSKVSMAVNNYHYFTEPDFVRHVALVATLQGAKGERIVGRTLRLSAGGQGHHS